MQREQISQLNKDKERLETDFETKVNAQKKESSRVVEELNQKL